MVPITVTLAILGGLIPALFWLWWWLREDRERPEPYLLIAAAFVGGIMVVPVALPLQHMAADLYTGHELLFVWVTIEEVLKYAAALLIILWHRAVDEPVDVIIYLIAIALGFAALENTLFIFNHATNGEVVSSILTGKLRFIGATLLHVLASGTVGAFIALAFYKSKLTKIMYGMLGLLVAIVLHALFNFFIIDGSGETILSVFLFVWMGIIVLLVVFEKVKLLEARHSTSTQL